MAFASMFLLVEFAIIIIGAISFAIGLILFIIGLANKKKAQKQNRKWPIVLIILGVLIMAPSVISTAAFSIFAVSHSYNQEHMLEKYDSVPECWMNENVFDAQASEQAVDALLLAAENGDRDEFVENFSEYAQDRDGFDDRIDAFLAAYPGNLSIENMTRTGNGGVSDVPANTRWSSMDYRGFIDGEYYRIFITFCYDSDDDPEYVGVSSFMIFNVGGAAEYFYGDDDVISKTRRYELIVCYLPDSDEVNARLIDWQPCLWQPSDGPVLTTEEMREAFRQYDTIQEAIDAGVIGNPNSSPVYKNDDGSIVPSNDFYYELQPVDGEARYARFRTTGGLTGRIIDCVEYTETSGDYENYIVR